MTLKKYVKSRLKFRLLLLSFIVCLIALTVIVLQVRHRPRKPTDDDLNEIPSELQIRPEVVVVEKYNERDIKVRLIKEKIKYLTQRKSDGKEEDVKTVLTEVTSHVHIFYTTHIDWTKEQKLKKNNTRWQSRLEQVPNTRYFPLLDMYETTEYLISQHFMKIKESGIGVVIITKTSKLTEALFEMILRIAKDCNIAVATELILPKNQSSNGITNHLRWLEKFSQSDGIYKVFSISRNQSVPLVYVKNAFNMEIDDKYFCANKKSKRKDTLKAVLIGHIKLKQHAELMRRLCFDGFYPRLPNNGVTFASTWKNWSYLKTFAQTYKMIFVPTVGPGFELPKYSSLEKQRSSGRYYEVAWRTAISTYIGFITLSSFNNWEEGTQIEEAKPKGPLYKSYDPGQPRKYLDLTTHWIDSFLKTAQQSQNSCYEFLNNTIC